MTIKITEEIVEVEVVKPQQVTPPLKPYDRLDKLEGVTYRIKPPTLGAALYVTINDLILPDGSKRPFEIFLNTKDKTHDQWMVALTRMISAIFRQPLSFAFVLDELKQVEDTRGSYFIPGGVRCGGVVSHVARVIEEHCYERGILTRPAVALASEVVTKIEVARTSGVAGEKCPKCGEYELYKIDGCLTCRSCGESKCG
jgi:ribonucleoside-diphosphate reductase alpha chain